MRTLQLIQKKQYRGAEIFSCQLSNNLLELGHQVRVVSIYEGDADLPFKGVVESLDRPMSKRYYDFRGWKMLAAIIKEYKPDILQANAADTLKYAIFSKIIHQWQTPVIFRNASASSFYIKDVFSKYLNRFLLERTSLVLSVSQASKKDLNQIFPFTEKFSQVLPVGVEGNKMIGGLQAFDKTLKHIFHIGSFTKEKNHIRIIAIYEKVNKRMPGTLLHLIGEGPLFKEIQESVRQKKLQNSVVFHGGVRNPYTYLNEADLLILPSLVEGLPAVLLEAMYCKIPVIAFDVGGISEIVTETTGSLVAFNDEEQFVELTLEILKKPDQQKIENAYDMVANHYTNQHIAQKFLKAYDDLLMK